MASAPDDKEKSTYAMLAPLRKSHAGDGASGSLEAFVRAGAEDGLTTSDYWHIALAFVLPGAVAMSPVLMPFGNPFAKDGDNSIADNWAYYFWYTPIGWCAMWVKIVLWNCELWDRDFFLPFMHGRPGLCRLNSSIVVVLVGTVWATGFFVSGYFIFHNPVPFGTISFGVPSFVVVFILLYFFVVPSDMRKTTRDHFRIIRCWLPFVFWVCALVIYMCLVWVQTFGVSQITNKYMFVAANMGVQIMFIVIRELFACMPLHWFMGDQSMDLSMLWGLGYGAMCATMSDWIFPGMPTDTAGLMSTSGVMVINFAMGMGQFLYAKDVHSVVDIFLNSICDVISGWAFLFIFTYNAFGPNQNVIYMISGMNRTQKFEAIIMIAVNFGFNLVKLLIMFCMAKTRYTPEMEHTLVIFGLASLRKWYWLVMWLLVSTCCCCGACMVMMHDGMDFSFTFDQWRGTWPFTH